MIFKLAPTPLLLSLYYTQTASMKDGGVRPRRLCAAEGGAGSGPHGTISCRCAPCGGLRRAPAGTAKGSRTLDDNTAPMAPCMAAKGRFCRRCDLERPHMRHSRPTRPWRRVLAACRAHKHAFPPRNHFKRSTHLTIHTLRMKFTNSTKQIIHRPVIIPTSSLIIIYM